MKEGFRNHRKEKGRLYVKIVNINSPSISRALSKLWGLVFFWRKSRLQKSKCACLLTGENQAYEIG